MADKLGLGNEVRQLKLGQSFTNPKTTGFHTVRYDFKPASVDINKMATVDVGNNHQVTVTVPHLDGAGVPHTVFKGSQRPCQKECVLIIDRVTGEITLEKLSSNLQVKKTRTELAKPQLSQSVASERSRPQTPPIGTRTSTKTKVTSGSRRLDKPITHMVPKHSPLHASPNYPSPGHYKSPKRDHLNVESHGQSTLASLPLIGMDDFSDPPPPPPPPPVEKSPAVVERVAEITDSSSSSSDSSDDSDHDVTVLEKTVTVSTNGYSNGAQNPSKLMPAHILNEDLCLSESGSDSD